MVHPRPKTPQGESVATPETPLLIILKHANRRYMANYSVRYSLSKVRGQKHPREVVKDRNSIPNISQYITSKYCQHPVQGNQSPRRAGHHRPSLPPSYTQLYIYIYTRTNYHECPSQTRGRQEETHCPSHRFRCLLLYLLWRDRQLCRHHGSRSAPIIHGQAVDTRQCQRRQTSFGIYCRPNILWWVCTQVYRQ